MKTTFYIVPFLLALSIAVPVRAITVKVPAVEKAELKTTQIGTASGEFKLSCRCVGENNWGERIVEGWEEGDTVAEANENCADEYPYSWADFCVKN